jgi:hypothetical protein
LLISEPSKMKKKQNSNKTFSYQSSEYETEDEYENEDEYDEETGVNKNKHLKSFRYFVTCS